MIYINFTSFVLIISLEKDYNMIETRYLKNAVFFPNNFNFWLSRKIIYIYNDIAEKHGEVTVKHFRKHEKFPRKRNSN